MKNTTSLISFLNVVLAFIISSNLNGQTIKKSSLFSSFANDLSDRNYYNITNIAWGFLPANNIPGRINEYKNNANLIQGENRSFHGRVEFDAGWLNFKEYCDANDKEYEDHECRTVDNKGYDYPWFPGQTHRGQTPRWISSHSPFVMNFLKYQVEQALTVDVDGLLLDAQTSSALATSNYGKGDFSIHCLKGFSKYLKNNFDDAQLANLGLNNTDVTKVRASTNTNYFNYRLFLKSKGFNDGNYQSKIQAHYANNPTLVPLWDSFKLFQSKRQVNITTQLIEHAQSIRSDVEVGTSSPLQDPYRATNFPGMGYFMLEPEMNITNYSVDIFLTYKYSESLNTPLILTALGDKWEDMIDNTLDEEVALGWFAMAYANGANFQVPIYQYAHQAGFYEPTINNKWKKLTDFVSENPTLLDEYTDAKSKVAVIQSWEGIRYNNFDINKIGEALNGKTIPFDLITIGDEYAPEIPTASELNSYDKVIVPKGVYDNFLADRPAIKTLLDNLGDKLVKWENLWGPSDATAIKNSLSTKFTVRAGGTDVGNDLFVSTRTHKNNASNDYIIHLTNQDYNANQNTYPEHNSVRVTFDVDSFEEEVVAGTLYRPGMSPKDLTVARNGNKVVVSGIDKVEVWGVLQLQHSEVITSVIDFAHSQQVYLTPNPASENISIYGVSEKEEWIIHDIKGNEILQGIGKDVDISGLLSGIYFIHVDGQNVKFYKK